MKTRTYTVFVYYSYVTDLAKLILNKYDFSFAGFHQLLPISMTLLSLPHLFQKRNVDLSGTEQSDNLLKCYLLVIIVEAILRSNFLFD